ncbi:hypothetical protein A4A49_13299 [Nicotiana attenuata]|uniref:Uncharacterized protein n=1 Tax=Nicotiana attenuata TaxID=49451 RepID=A0A1J6I6N7_NICAT|nr:hypothetical protein A4A49_13299 [Nicotiana attenuata]
MFSARGSIKLIGGLISSKFRPNKRISLKIKEQMHNQTNIPFKQQSSLKSENLRSNRVRINLQLSNGQGS